MLPSPSPIDIPEIFKLICESLSNRKSTLASLARTCRKFHEPSIDVLWLNIEKFDPLAKCLPPDVWEEKQDGDNLTMRLTCPLLPVHCSRFLHYAKRVRIFSNEQDKKGQSVHRTVYEGLQVAIQGKLLPNVNELTWTCNSNTFRFIHMFLGPRVSKITYNFSAGSFAQNSMVVALREQYPLLEHVDPSVLNDSTSLQSKTRAFKLISDTVYAWDQLKSLKVPSLTYPALLKVSQLRQLELLEITTEYKLDGHPPAAVSKGFPKLVSLKLNGCFDVPSFISVLNLLGPSPLRELNFYLDQIETPSSWERAFMTINQHCSRTTLQKIQCWDGDDVRNTSNSDPTDMVKFENVRPLLNFKNFTDIDIGFSKGLYLSDASATKEMAAAWKHTRLLRMDLPNKCRSRDFSTITILDFLPFATHCPELRILSLPFNATSTPEIDINNPPWGDRLLTTSLYGLVVGDSPIGDPTLVAATLSAIFPSLKKITTIEQLESEVDDDDPGPLLSNLDGDNHKKWKDVERMIKVFNAVRQQERVFAQSHRS